MVFILMKWFMLFLEINTSIFVLQLKNFLKKRKNTEGPINT
jgi:hypothetical protein